MKQTVVIISPKGTAKIKLEKVSRALVARILFDDWRSKNTGEYFDLIQKGFTQEEKDKFPRVIDQRLKIAELVSRECEVFVDGVAWEVKFTIEKYWNQLNHNIKS